MNKLIIFLILILIINACSKNEKEILKIKETRQDLEMISVLEDAYKALEAGDTFEASKKFLDAELIYPQSEWAPKALLMAAYSFYLQNSYSETLLNLERYLKIYPKDENVIYAHYLIAMSYYETIQDEKRDTAPLIKAKEKFNFIVENYPNTDFAIDSRFKLNLIDDLLASKEMYLGRYYLNKEKWIAAINRFKTVVNLYDQTVFIEEALYRLVEIYFKIGLENESQKYAKLLGYNYLSGEWYKKSYKIFNSNYSINRPKSNKKGVIDRFSQFFE